MCSSEIRKAGLSSSRNPIGLPITEGTVCEEDFPDSVESLLEERNSWEILHHSLWKEREGKLALNPDLHLIVWKS